jgi:poly-gamma-glutamate capsule biosynthesis protein CapA/YwtB (metallophosphatase superfamily)
MSSAGAVKIAFVGDLILHAPDPLGYFARCRDAIAADVAVAQIEWPHTTRGAVCALEVPAPAAPPANLAALAELGFRVATVASNHTFDQGPYGVEDTLSELRRLGVATAGAGMTLDEARRPAILEQAGLRLGFLAYNAVGPRESWATAVKAGAAYVRIVEHYEVELASPGALATEFTAPDVDSLAEMQDDIARLRAEVDVVCVVLHKGVGFVRAQLAQYERPLARAAIDAGADVVIGHHAHILRGVEIYRNRPIYHGINHFVTAYEPSSNPAAVEAQQTRPFPRRSPIRGQLGEPDREVRNFPYARESRHTMVASLEVDAAGVVNAGFVPCWIDEQARPVAHGDDEEGRATVDYVSAITAEAGLSAELSWADDRVVFYRRDATAAAG